MSEDVEVLRAKLVAETGKMEWHELERHFARGAVVAVNPGIDLIDVALTMANDDKAGLEKWFDAGTVRRAETADAAAWVKSQPLFWVVVILPWVVIQEIDASAVEPGELH
ncbi:MAG: DUF2288 domain-containing protein [Thiotrichaceae bacterium]|nr:DUF2288 domain-containing protein [Thiotrichaceae bacterium]